VQGFGGVRTTYALPAANEDLVPPQDVQPEELDVAIAVDRVETVTTLQIRKIKRAWAGLRSFVADKTPVVGFAPDAPGFFWPAGQGGYGIQTAPAMGELAAALVQGLPVPNTLAALGVREQMCHPHAPAWVHPFEV
jgi:D-arginine dehydrogenase